MVQVTVRHWLSDPFQTIGTHLNRAVRRMRKLYQVGCKLHLLLTGANGTHLALCPAFRPRIHADGIEC